MKRTAAKKPVDSIIRRKTKNSSILSLKTTTFSSARKSLVKMTAFLLIIGLNWSVISLIGGTDAYFTDTATISGNTFTAARLDFYLHSGQNNFVPKQKSEGIEPGDEVNRVIQVKQSFPGDGLPFKYIVSFQKTAGDDSFCETLQLKADLQGSEIYDGSLFEFISAPILYSSGSDTWHFKLSLPQDAVIELRKICNFSFVFSGWQENISISGGGFSDTEEISNSIKSGDGVSDDENIPPNGNAFTIQIKTFLSSNGNGSVDVVMNEFLPNPEGFEYGFYFGTDESKMSQGEWIELYNNSGVTSYNLSGWYFKDLDGNIINITNANSSLNTTIIQPKTWMVIYMNKAVLDNSGDESITLYNQNDKIIDSYTYSGNGYCDLTPSPETSNINDSSGGCSGVPPNKSYARIPNGTGGWVDPIPTPGETNEIEENLVAVGLGDLVGSDGVSDDAIGSTQASPPWVEVGANDGDDTGSDDTIGSTQEYGANSDDNTNDYARENGANGEDGSAADDGGFDDLKNEDSDTDAGGADDTEDGDDTDAKDEKYDSILKEENLPDKGDGDGGDDGANDSTQALLSDEQENGTNGEDNKISVENDDSEEEGGLNKNMIDSVQASAC